MRNRLRRHMTHPLNLFFVAALLATLFAAPALASVSFVSFIAQSNSSEQAIVVTWETATEENSLGFKVWRTAVDTNNISEVNASDLTELTSSLIQAVGNLEQGSTYDFVDTAPEPNVTYFYWLEEHESTGGTIWHGPRAALLSGTTLGGFATATPTPTTEPTVAASPTPTPSRTPTVTPDPSATPTQTPTAASTTVTATLAATSEATASATTVSTTTATVAPTATEALASTTAATAAATATTVPATITPTATLTTVPTIAATVVVTATAELTPTATSVPAATQTPLPTLAPTNTVVPLPTATIRPTAQPTQQPSPIPTEPPTAIPTKVVEIVESLEGDSAEPPAEISTNTPIPQVEIQPVATEPPAPTVEIITILPTVPIVKASLNDDALNIAEIGSDSATEQPVQTLNAVQSATGSNQLLTMGLLVGIFLTGIGGMMSFLSYQRAKQQQSNDA